MNTQTKINTTKLNEVFRLVRLHYFEELTLEQLKANYEQYKKEVPEVKQYLNSLKVTNLKSVLNQMGSWHDSRDKKADLIDKVCSNMKSYFFLDRGVAWIWGEGTYEDAVQKTIDYVMTEEYLSKWYAKRRAEKEKVEKSLANPQTLEEFNIFIGKNGKDKLTPDQIITYETMLSDRKIEIRKQQEVREAVVQKVSEDVKFELHKTKHTKTGIDLWTVRMVDRVEKDMFTSLRTKSKQLGGWYSRYTDKFAKPPVYAGFQFDSEENAHKFMGLLESDQSSQEVKEERKEAKVESKSEKLRAMGKRMIEKGEESLNQERRTNTQRQASQAASSEAKAKGEITFGKKLIKIADGFEKGEIKYLQELSNGKQLEQLEQILRGGRYYRQRGMSTRERELDNAGRMEDVNYIKYPYPTWGYNVIHSVFTPHLDTGGMMRDSKKVLDYARQYKNEHDHIILTSSYSIEVFKNAAKKLKDKWERERIIDEIRDYERIQSIGLTDDVLLKTALRELIQLSEGTGISEEQKAELELKEMERAFIGRKIPGFFPTPKPLIEKMFAMARVFEGETILEPSAGLGHIAEAIREKYPHNQLSCIEFNYDLWEILKKKGFDDTEQINFLATTHKYDVIFMNPPFENHQDIDHVKHAFSLLNEGGRLVSIMAGNKFNSQKVVQEFMTFVQEYGYLEENEAGAFKSAFISTGVNTCTVYLEKPNN